MGHVALLGEIRNLYKVLVGKSGVKSPLRRSSHKVDITDIGFGVMDWIHVAKDRDDWKDLVNMVMNLV